MEIVDNLNIQNFRMGSFTIRYRMPYFNIDEKPIYQAPSVHMPPHHSMIADALRHFDGHSKDITCTIYVFDSEKPDHHKARLLIVGDLAAYEHLVNYFEFKARPENIIVTIAIHERGFFEFELNEFGAPYGRPLFHVQAGDFYYNYEKTWYKLGILRSNAAHKDVIAELVDRIEKIKT